MTHDPHEELTNLLRELHEALPEMRFGQLVCNLATIARGPEPEAAWDVEDGELLEAAKEQLNAVRHRSEARA